MAKWHRKQLELDFDIRPEELLSPDDIYRDANEDLLSRLGEDRRLERKPANHGGEALGVYFSMWSNTSPDGGLIVLGQRDKKNGRGFEGCKSLSSEGLNKAEKCAHTYCPDARFESRRVEVRNLNGEADFVILFRVFYHRDIVVKTSGGRAYSRRGDEKHLLSPEEVRDLAVDKGQVSFETEDCPAVYPQDFDMEAIRRWAAKVRKTMNSGHDLSDCEIMENRRLGRSVSSVTELTEFIPNNACTLIFAKDPRKWFPGCKLRVIRYEGDAEGSGETYNAVKEIWVEGPIPDIIDGADEAIRSQLRTFMPLGKDGRFEDAEEYPFEAWHEAIVNACVHRSYGNGLKNVPIFVRLFENRMEIESPGPFPPYVTAKNIYKMHVPRHPYLMEALFFAQLVRMNREGTRRMRDTMRDRGLPEPEFAQTEIGHALVRVTLRNDIAHRRIWIDRDVSKIVSETLAASLSPDQKRVVNWLAASDSGTITTNGVVKLLGISWQSARKTLFELCRLKVLQYVRFKPLKKDRRDVRAFFRLRSTIPLPEGAHEASVPDK